MNLSVAIVTHPARAADLPGTLDAVYGADHTTILSDDHGMGCWRNCMRAWRSVSERATHHLVIEDDLIFCRDFMDGVRAAIEMQPYAPISFYANRKECQEAHDQGKSWVLIPDGTWGQAVCLPAQMARDFTAWCDRRISPEAPKGEHVYLDSFLALYLMEIKKAAWCTVPSLVDHAGANRSLIGIGHAQKRARVFLGADRSALEIDWTKGFDRPVRGKPSMNPRYRAYLLPEAS